MYPWQDGADLDHISTIIDKLIANFVIIVVLAVVLTILLIAVSVLVYLWRRPKGAQNPMNVLLGTLNELVQQLKDQELRAQTERTSFAAMIAESTIVLKRMADWQDGSKDRHEIYTDGFRVAVRQIAEDLGKANIQLAEQGRTHTTDALTAQFGAARQEVKQTVTDELHKLNEEMERRASANGERFTALDQSVQAIQSTLDKLAQDVANLVQETHEVHTELSEQVLGQVSKLKHDFAALQAQVQAQPALPEKSTPVEHSAGLKPFPIPATTTNNVAGEWDKGQNSAPAENVGTSKEPPPPAKSAPKEPKEGI